MLITNKEKLEAWRTELVAGWYDHRTPAINQDLVTRWSDIVDEMDAKFPDLVLWLAPASDSSIGMDVHKLLIGSRWSEQMAIVHTETPDAMNLYGANVTGDEGIDVPFDKEVLFKFLDDFRQGCTK